MGKDNPAPPKPEITRFQATIWEIFCALSRSRQYGMSPMPISISDMKAAFSFSYLPKEDHFDACFVLQELDREWLNEAMGNNAKDAPKSGNEGNEDPS